MEFWDDTRRVPVAYLIGLLATLAGLFNVTVTLATGDYTPILRWALVLAGVAAACFTLVAVKGPRTWRWIAALSLAPVAYIVAEVFGRFGA